MKKNLTKLAEEQIKEIQFKKAVAIYRKNPDLYLALKELRKRDYKSLRDSVNRIKEEYPKAKVSSSNMRTWKRNFQMFIGNDRLFGDFVIAVGMDPARVNQDARNL